MKTTNSYEAQNYKGGELISRKEFNSIEEADKFCTHKNQCVCEECVNDYSTILHYRDDENYNNLYFI